jgi:hypothetical protein
MKTISSLRASLYGLDRQILDLLNTTPMSASGRLQTRVKSNVPKINQNKSDCLTADFTDFHRLKKRL